MVEGGKLRLGLVSYGDTSSNVGGVFTGLGLNMKDLGVPLGTGSITGIKTQVTIRAAKAQGCAANTDTTTAPRV